MAWFDGLLSIFESFKTGFQNNTNNFNKDYTTHNISGHNNAANVNTDDYIDSSWSGVNLKF